MKLLLYCTKAKPYLVRDIRTNKWSIIENVKKDWLISNNKTAIHNGLILAECDFEVEEIKYHFGYYNMGDWFESYILENACLTHNELDDYLQASKDYDEKKIAKTCGYGIHIKNLHIFDEPKELDDYYTIPKKMNTFCGISYVSVNLEKAPQNMMWVLDDEEKKILISIRPEWLCKILNGEKTIEVRKKVLKEMINLI